MARPSPQRATAGALALGALLALTGGCRCGGRRSVEAGRTPLADVGEAAPEVAEQVRAAGAVADTLLAARRSDIDQAVRTGAATGRPRPRPDADRPGDRIAA